MELVLSTINGTTEGATISVAPGECISVGRTTAAQESFPNDTHMSSLHFEVENFGSWAELRDKRSTNGTWLNNNRITAERLSDGDQIRAGTTLFAVQYRHSAVPSGPPCVFSESIVLPDNSPDMMDGNPFTSDPKMGHSPQAGNGNSLAGKHQIGPSYVAPFTSTSGSSLGVHANSQDASSPIFAESKSPKPLSSIVSSSDSGGKLLDDIHRHLDKRLTPFGDSIDLSEIVKAEKSAPVFAPIPGEAVVERPGSRSPISDSSIIVPGPIKPLAQSPGKTPGNSAEFGLFSLRLSTSLSDGLITIVERLSLDHSVQVVVHPQKIRQSIPGSIETSKALWSCYGSVSGFGPHAIPWIDFRQVMLPFVERLCKSDALMIFVGNQLDVMMARLQQLPLIDLPGFSEEGGFLNCFWPSAIVTMLNARGARCCEDLFAGCFSGLLMPSPFDWQVLLAAASTDLVQTLSELRFQPIARLG